MTHDAGLLLLVIDLSDSCLHIALTSDPVIAVPELTLYFVLHAADVDL